MLDTQALTRPDVREALPMCEVQYDRSIVHVVEHLALLE